MFEPDQVRLFLAIGTLIALVRVAVWLRPWRWVSAFFSSGRPHG